jgi:protein-tyrosine phosphatase
MISRGIPLSALLRTTIRSLTAPKLKRGAVLFVCTANICRSPTAAAVMRKIARRANLHAHIDSVGTRDCCAWMPPHPMAVAVGKRRGYDLTGQTARQIRQFDFEYFDLILAMDKSHVKSLRAIAPKRFAHKIRLLLDFGLRFPGQEVPDPFERGVAHYERALELIEDGCRGLAATLHSALAEVGLRARPAPIPLPPPSRRPSVAG